MKKNLSLILALVMILGSFSSVFAAVAPVETPVDAGAFLKDKGVLVGNAEGDLMLDELLARQDAVILVAQLRGMVEAALAYPGDAGYEDVKDPFYNGPLKWAKDEGLFVGRTEKVFGFDDNLTVQEYAKVLLTALGYSVGPNGGVDIAWDKALDKAEEFGILANLKDLVETDGVKRGDMALMTFNALSVMMKDGKMTLAESLKIEMPEAKELTAEVKDTENLREVVLELSNAKLADEAKLLDKNNYRVEKFKVQKVTLDGNNVILLLDNALVKNRTYDLAIRGLDKAVDKKYTFKANDNSSPEVVSVVALGEYGIKVTTSEPVKDAQERDFLVDGKNIAMNLETYGRDIILTPYYNASFALDSNTLTIKGLEDYAGYKSALVDFDLKVEKDSEAPKVTDVTVDGKVVEVTFDKDVRKGSLDSGRDGNVYFRSGRIDVFAKSFEKVDTNKVKYTFEENLPRRTEVTILDVQNHSKITMEKTTMLATEMKNNLEPIIVDYEIDKNVAAGEVTITIEFDKNIDNRSIDRVEKSFAKNDNFRLFGDKVLSRYESVEGEKIVSIDYAKEGTVDVKDTLVLKLSDIKKNTADKYDYILEVRNFEDESGNRMYTDYIEFDLSEEKVLEVTNVTVKHLRDETEIAIDFSRSVDRVRAEDKTNYLFRKLATDTKVYDVANLDGDVIVESNGKTVTLKLPKFEGKGYDHLEILQALRDKDGNRLTGNVTFNLLTVEDDFKVIKELKAAQDAVKALFADYSTKAALAAGVTQADITAALSKVQALPNSTTKSGLVADVGIAQNILNNAAIVKNSIDAINVAAASTTWLAADQTVFAAAGVTGVTVGNLSAVQSKLQTLAAGINQNWTAAQIQGVVNGVLTQLELDGINAAAASTTWGSIDETNFAAAGVTGVTAVNLSTVKAELQTEAGTVNQGWTAAQVQGFVNTVIQDLNLVAAAKAEIEALTNAEVGLVTVEVQATADAKAQIAVNALPTVQALSGTAVVAPGTIVTAVAGTTDGSYPFTVTITQGSVTVTTATVTIVIPQ